MLILNLMLQSPWAVHREVSLYGDEPEMWRPERWICGDEKKAAMYNALLTVSTTTTHHEAP